MAMDLRTLLQHLLHVHAPGVRASILSFFCHYSDACWIQVLIALVCMLWSLGFATALPAEKARSCRYAFFFVQVARRSLVRKAFDFIGNPSLGDICRGLGSDQSVESDWFTDGSP